VITVLLIADRIDDARMVREILKNARPQEYQLIHCVTISEAIELLRGKHKIDVILSDISLPDSQGEKTFNRLKRVAANLPVVFFTGTHDESLAEAALQKGAQDYLIKGQFDSDALTRAVRYAIERKKFQHDMQRVKNQARALKEKTRLLKMESAELLALNEAKDDFISLASHQLRTPATGVKQYVGMLKDGFAGRLTKKQQTLLEVAYESNERQLGIVNDLLKVAQIDAGNLEIHKQPTEVVSLLQQLIAEHRLGLQKRRQTLRLGSSSKKVYANIDAEKMRMALDNIIDNASKYSPEGKPITIRVSAKSDRVRIEVKDKGVGIDKSNLDKVFRKFARIHNPLTGTVGGSGLGLYWVKKVVDLHGGSINVVSRPAQGSTFIIELPDKKGDNL
jgi:signal transduction histidine kinase